MFQTRQRRDRSSARVPSLTTRARAALRRGALRALAAAALAAWLAAGPAAANGCGAPGAPCAAGGGIYHARVPEGPGPHPAVLYLHGYGGRAAAAIANRAVVPPLLARGYAVIAPQGAPRRQGDKGGSWNAFAAVDRRDDVAFIEAVMKDARRRFALDPERVLAAGFSGGGMMVWRIACDRPEAFAAYAPIAGLLWRPLPERCGGPVRLLHTHGWSDPVVPMEGRSVAGGRITQGDLFEGLGLLRAASRCARDAPDSYDARDGFLIRRWTSCAAGAELALALHPGGHKVPKGWPALALDWFEAAPGR